MNASLKQRVARRAWWRCEYCQMPQEHTSLPFHIDHVIAQQHRGRTRVENLAFACAFCNAHKGPSLSGIDPITRKIVTLFNPRQDQWQVHFRWDRYRLHGLTPVGRATVEVLAINHPVALAMRANLMEEGLF